MIERKEKILQIIIENNRITSNKLKDISGVSKATIKLDISKLREEGKLEYIESSKNGYWKLKKSRNIIEIKYLFLIYFI